MYVSVGNEKKNKKPQHLLKSEIKDVACETLNKKV